jgi:hypothetical protein
LTIYQKYRIFDLTTIAYTINLSSLIVFGGHCGGGNAGST